MQKSERSVKMKPQANINKKIFKKDKATLHGISKRYEDTKHS